MRLRGIPLAPGRAYGRIALRPHGGPKDGIPTKVWACPPEAAEGPEAEEGMRPPIAWIVPGSIPPGLRGTFPVVGALDPDLFREEERVLVDGGLGTVDLDGVEGVEVVTAFLEEPGGRVLLLRRSQQVGSFRGRWAAVSGYLESALPIDQALQEIREETGIAASEVDLVRDGASVYARGDHRIFVVHPFRFRLRSAPHLHLDWEHTEARWVEPSDLGTFETVPHLDTAWSRVGDDPSARAKG